MRHRPDLRNCSAGRHPAQRRRNGFVMIEVLIAILIFSIAVLGLVGLQISMRKAQTSAKFRADAAYLANDLVGTMWADANHLADYTGTACKTTSSACQKWESRLATVLPGSSHEVTADATAGSATFGDVTIKISWKVPNEGQHQYITTTTITLN